MGNVDGAGAAARFGKPSVVTTDAAGNVYVADNHAIRRITPTGVVTTLAGVAGTWGQTDGAGSAARFRTIASMAVGAAGNVYVVDSLLPLNPVVRKVTAAGLVSTVSDSVLAVGLTDSTGATISSFYPHSLTADATGNVYFLSATTIRQLTPAGVVTTVFNNTGSVVPCDEFMADSSAVLCYPSGFTRDGAGNFYVRDNRTVIKKISPTGIVTALPDSASTSIAADSTGNVFVAEANTHTIRKITPAGVKSTVAGDGTVGSTDGVGAVARLSSPVSVAVDGAGNVYVADSDNATIRKITPDGATTTLAGQVKATGSADGVGALATFSNAGASWEGVQYRNESNPNDVAVDTSSNIYVADSDNATRQTVSAPQPGSTTLAAWPWTRRATCIWPTAHAPTLAASCT